MKVISVIGVRGFPGVQGGVEMHCENIYTRMHKNYRLRIYRRRPYLTEVSARKFKNTEYVDLPSTRIKGLEAVIHSFFAAIHIIFHRPDAVHIHNIGPGMFAPLIKMFRIPIILTYHSPNYEHKKWGRLSRAILKLSEKISLSCASKVIFVNSFQREKLGEKVLAKSVFIPNGINKTKIGRSTGSLRTLGIESRDFILSVGRLTPEKGFEYLVEAVNKLDEVKHLVIAGASDHDNSYFKMLKQLDWNDKVIFTGFTQGEDLRQLYSHARLYVLSSVNEGFPLVLLEAMSYQLPLVVTDIPATHLIQLPEDNYVEVANSDALAEGISNALKKDFQLQHYDLKDYNWDSIAKQTLDVYRQVLEK